MNRLQRMNNIVELNLRVNFTTFSQFNGFCNKPPIASYELQVTSYELWATGHKLRARSCEMEDTSYEIRHAKFIKWRRSTLMRVRYNTWSVKWFYGANPHRTLTILEDFATQTPGGSSAVQSLDEAAAISKLIIQSMPFAEFYQLDQSVNLIVVEMLELVLYFFCDGVCLNLPGNTANQYRSF